MHLLLTNDDGIEAQGLQSFAEVVRAQPSVTRVTIVAPIDGRLVHVTADGECSWHQFAQTIYQEALAAGVLDKAPRLVGIPSNEYPTKAKRPMYSRLDCSRFATDFDMRLPDWRLGLNQVLAEMV